MPSLQHQTLVLWGIRCMLRDGFTVLGADGAVERAGLPEDFPRPPLLRSVRADACGIDHARDVVAFVEAKTASDIDNAHTRKQLRALTGLQMVGTGHPCVVYLAIPRAAAYALDRVLIDLGLLGARHVRRVHVPSALLEAA